MPWNPATGVKRTAPVAGSRVNVPVPATVSDVTSVLLGPSRRTRPLLGRGTVTDCSALASPVEVRSGAGGAGGAVTVGVYVAVALVPK